MEVNEIKVPECLLCGNNPEIHKTSRQGYVYTCMNKDCEMYMYSFSHNAWFTLMTAKPEVDSGN